MSNVRKIERSPEFRQGYRLALAEAEQKFAALEAAIRLRDEQLTTLREEMARLQKPRLLWPAGAADGD